MVQKILVVDDNFEDLSLMKDILTSSDYEVELAIDGAEALQKVGLSNFDLILLDIKMPTLSGYDLLKLLKEMVNGKVKIIYVTIVPKKEVDLDGVHGFVQKPFDNKTFLTTIKKVLHSKVSSKINSEKGDYHG